MAEHPLGHMPSGGQDLNQRLDALGSQVPVVAGAAAAAGLGAAPLAARGPGGEAFLRAVAARRAAVIGKALAGGFGAVGVVVVVVLFSMRVPRPETSPPQRTDEPTYWNLRAGVEAGGEIDGLVALDAGSGVGGGSSNAAITPRQWPDDLRP